jgi:hypothetical protein
VRQSHELNNKEKIMNTFITLAGEKVKSASFMAGPKLTKRCYWAITGNKTYVETRGILESFDINDRFIFGYKEDEFMAKQYK